MRWDLPLLTANSKTGISLDLPMQGCSPTAVCAQVCYASQGRQNFYRSVVKSLAVDRLVDADPERASRKIVDEAAGRSVRIGGSGEMLPKHKALLGSIERFGGDWWGFTRRVDTHRLLPELMFSIDQASPKQVLNYVSAKVSVGRRAYLRRPVDPPSPMPVAVTFPVHGSWTNYADRVPEGPSDCPAARKQVSGCWECQRCYR